MTPTAIRIKPEDIETINSWLDARDFGGRLVEGWIPRVGYWVPGVVSCFLFQTDTKAAYIDSFCCAPTATRKERRDGMIACGEALCDEAKRLGYEKVLGLTNYQSIVDTAIACGFTISERNYTYMTKELKGL